MILNQFDRLTRSDTDCLREGVYDNAGVHVIFISVYGCFVARKI